VKINWRIGIVVLAGTLALTTGIGIALAKGANGGQQVQAGYYAASDGSQFAAENVNQWYCGGRGFMMGYVTPQVTALIGTTAADLKAQLSSGRTLADIAKARGVTDDQLVQTMMGPYADHLALMVKYGYLTQEQADASAQQARTRLQTVITSSFNLEDSPQGGFGGMMRGWFNRSPQSGTNQTSGHGSGMMGGSGGGMMGRR
jgi:hypothetical protein